MTDTLRIAHCSDIHLDSDMTPGADRTLGADFHQRAFAAALEAIKAGRPDLMLLAGDLFDTNRARDDTIEWAMETLGRLPFPVVMIPGNHDCMQAQGIYRRYDFNDIPNVDMLSDEEGQLALLSGLDVAVWGKGMVEHCPDYRPLGECPDRPEGCRWFLGMGHGLFVPHGGDTDRSSPIHMRELEESACDYLALGHHHAAMELVTERTAAAYSGSPTDTLGRGATYVTVELAVAAPPSLAIRVLDAPA